VGHILRRQLREVLGPEIRGLPRLVALEIADCAFDDTRQVPDRVSLADLARWTGAGNEGSVRDALTKLAAAGWEFRVPISKGGNGRMVYAGRGHALTFAVPPFAAPVERRTANQRPFGSTKGRQSAAQTAGMGRQPARIGPPTGGPIDDAPFFLPKNPSSLSARERLAAEHGNLTDEREISDFLGWMQTKYPNRSAGWWRTLAANGDLAEHVAMWHAQQSAAREPERAPLPAPCGHPDCDPVSRMRIVRNAHGVDTGKVRRCECHPKYAQAAQRPDITAPVSSLRPVVQVAS